MEILVAVIIAVAVVGAALLPLMRRTGAPAVRRDERAAPDLDSEVGTYREAIRAGTVCGSCGRASPAGSLFCMECGRALPARDARVSKDTDASMAGRRTDEEAAGPIAQPPAGST
jgi:hypothetical protein